MEVFMLNKAFWTGVLPGWGLPHGGHYSKKQRPLIIKSKVEGKCQK